MSEAEPFTDPSPDHLLVGRYRLEEVLGRGGMGEVHRAFDVKLRRRVAVKLLIDTTGPDGRARAVRFLREAQAVAALKHPNIVAVHDVGEDSGTPFIVMEYVDGTSLSEVLASGQ